MNFTVPPFVAYLGAWFATLSGIWALFERAESVVSDDFRSRMGKWLKSQGSAPSLREWSPIFVVVFDNVFGAKHLSWTRFARSTVVSLAAVAIMSIWIAAVVPGIWVNSVFSDGGGSPAPLRLLVVALCVNVLGDYVSLTETRIVVGWLQGRSLKVQAFGLLLDLVATSIVFYVSIVVGVVLLAIVLGDEYLVIGVLSDSILNIWWSGAAFWRAEGARGTFAVWLYPAYLTTLWTWLFFGSSLLLRVLGAVRGGIALVSRVLDVEAKPLRSIGFVSMIIATVAFALLPFVAG